MAQKTVTSINKTLEQFKLDLQPFEASHDPKFLHVFTDNRTGARYAECHIKGSVLVEFGTTDVPLDPDQPDYRANRDLVTNAPAFARMKEDAKQRRSFSSIVAEYTKDSDPGRPLKIIGGQHRFEAIKEGLSAGIDEYHGVKVYLDLTMDQRLDAQLISNTSIAISSDLFDRMQETFKGPELREWCQKAGLLETGEDFADRRVRGGTITVQMARTFITNYFRGHDARKPEFDKTDTTPTLSPTGSHDGEWEKLRKDGPKVWSDQGLMTAAKEYALLAKAQRDSFVGRKPKPPIDYPEKASNAAVMAAWAYIAGLVAENKVRLQRHYDLRKIAGKDPLNAAALAKGRHKTDPENYRGLGYRTDAKERGRLVELFYVQAEDGKGITPATIDIAIKKYHAKQAQLEVVKAKERGS